MELAQVRVQWRALVLEVLNLRILLPVSVIQLDIMEIVCEDGKSTGWSLPPYNIKT